MKIFFLARLELYSFGQSKKNFTSDRNICSLRIHTVISCTSPCTEHIPQFQVINKQYKNVGALHQRFKAFVHLLSARMGIFKKSSRWSLQKFDVKCPPLEKGITLFAAQDPHRALLSLCPLLSQLDPHQLLRRGTGQSLSHPCQLLAGGTSQYMSRIFPFNIHLLLDPLGLGPFFLGGGSTPLFSLGNIVCISLTNFPDIPQTVFFPASESYRPDNFPKPGSTSRPL